MTCKSNFIARILNSVLRLIFIFRIRKGASESPRTDPNRIEVKSPKTRGRQLSIKDISSVTPEPTRGWDENAATTKILFL